MEQLKKCYNNSFYPRTLKLENYKKNINSSLPVLTQYNFTNVVTESNYDNMINHYKEIYNNQDEINDNEDRSTTINYIFSNNKITKDESEYMKKIIKKNILLNKIIQKIDKLKMTDPNSKNEEAINCQRKTKNIKKKIENRKKYFNPFVTIDSNFY